MQFATEGVQQLIAAIAILQAVLKQGKAHLTIDQECAGIQLLCCLHARGESSIRPAVHDADLLTKHAALHKGREQAGSDDHSYAASGNSLALLCCTTAAEMQTKVQMKSAACRGYVTDTQQQL